MRIKFIKSKKFLLISAFVVLVFLSFIVMYNLNVFRPSLERVKDSVVMIEVYDREDNLISTGSGFCAYKDNFIVTNFHVIEGGYSFKVIDDSNKAYKVNKILIFNKKDDLAILRINGKLKKLKVNANAKVRVKDSVTAIGSPKGEKNTVSEGIVSNIDDKDFIRISVPISHGSSGGVLLNKRYEVIGITNAGYDDAENLNFAIRSKLLKRMYDNYKVDYYDTIKTSNYESCAPNIANYNTQVQLRIRNKCGFSGKKDYTVDSFDMFYTTTDSSELFNTAMSKLGDSNGFSSIYKKLSKEEQIKASEYYTEILEYEDCNTESKDSCSIDNIDNWNREEMVLELDVMPAYGLAIFEAGLDKYSSKDLFNYVNSFPMSIPEKGTLSLLFGFSPRDLTRDNAKAVIEYINSKNISSPEKGKILSYLGYTVNESSITW